MAAMGEQAFCYLNSIQNRGPVNAHVVIATLGGGMALEEAEARVLPFQSHQKETLDP